MYVWIQIAIQGPRYDILVLLCGTRIVPIACGWTRREARKAGMVCFFLVPNTNRLKVAKIRRLHWWQWFPKFSFQHMSLYSNTAISGSNVDIPTLEEISRFTHAPKYRCSRPKRYTQLTIINKIDLKECHSLTWDGLFALSCLDAEVRKVNYTTFLKTKQ